MSIVNRSQSSGGSTPRSDFNHARNADSRASFGDQHGCPAHLGIGLADVRSAVTQLPRVPRDAVHRDPGVATQVLTLARPRHRPDTELAIVEVRIGAAQPRRAVSTDGSQHSVGRRRQDRTDAVGKVWFDVLDIGEAGHQPSLVHRGGLPAGHPARIGTSPHVGTLASGDKEPTVGRAPVTTERDQRRSVVPASRRLVLPVASGLTAAFWDAARTAVAKRVTALRHTSTVRSAYVPVTPRPLYAPAHGRAHESEPQLQALSLPWRRRSPLAQALWSGPWHPPACDTPEPTHWLVAGTGRAVRLDPGRPLRL